MPASEIIPNFPVFVEALRRTGVYGGRQYAVDVLEPALKSMGVANRKTLEQAVRASREVPAAEGAMRGTAIFAALDFPHVEELVKKTFRRIRLYEEDAGIAELCNTRFIQRD